MYLHQHRQPPDDLQRALRSWIASNPFWYLRETRAEHQNQPWAFSMPLNRRAAADEVASAIVNDPALRATLTLLASPPGEAIEQAIAQFWLPGWQAELLADGLTRAWEIVLDQNRPLWQRVDVLLGTVLVLGLVGIMIWAGRDTH
jgi:hypothetical protein